MFVQEYRDIPVPAAVAHDRLSGFLREQRLHVVASDAVAAGHKMADLALASAPVTVATLPSYARGQARITPIRWTTPDVLGRPFANLDANLELSATDEHVARLGLVGAYRPLGHVDPDLEAGLAWELLGAMTLTTARWFLDGLADRALHPPQ